MAQPTPPFALAVEEAAIMNAQGITARAIAIGHRISAPPGDITPRLPPRFPIGACIAAQEAGQLRDVGDGGEAVRRARGDVVAGGRGEVKAPEIDPSRSRTGWP